VPYSAFVADGDSEIYHEGHEHGLNGVLEGVIPVGARLSIALRAQAGVRMLVFAGDLKDGVERFLSLCEDSGATRCEVDRGPVFGSAFGGMFGLVGAGRVRWRVDLAVERVLLPGPDSSVTTDSLAMGTTTQYSESTIYTTRSWVFGGIEL
jgi:hypothetical protein